MKSSPTFLTVSGPPPVCGAGWSSDGTSQHPKVGFLLSTRPVTAVNVDTELVYFLPEVVKHLKKENALSGRVWQLICVHHTSHTSYQEIFALEY